MRIHPIARTLALALTVSAAAGCARERQEASEAELEQATPAGTSFDSTVQGTTIDTSSPLGGDSAGVLESGAGGGARSQP